MTVPAEEDKSKAFIPENLERMLTEVIHQRGKRNTDTKKLAETLRKLIEIAETPAQKVTCMLLLVAVQFDKVISLVTYLPPDEWTTYVRARARARAVRAAGGWSNRWC